MRFSSSRAGDSGTKGRGTRGIGWEERTERAMDRAAALRRCSVTGYIPGIPRGHGHISSSSRFPVSVYPAGLPIPPARRYMAGTRNNGVRGRDGPRHTSEFPSPSVSGLPRRRGPTRKSSPEHEESVRTFPLSFSLRVRYHYCTVYSNRRPSSLRHRRNRRNCAFASRSKIGILIPRLSRSSRSLHPARSGDLPHSLLSIRANCY